MLKAQGIIKVEHSQRMVLEVSEDFTKYYSWFVMQRYWVKVQQPLHKSHITLALPKFHDNVDWGRAMDYHDQVIEFEYDPYLIEGGFTKGFIMFYVKVYSADLEYIKKDIGVVEKDDYRGLHLTIGQIGKKGAKPTLHWPEMVTIKN